MISRTAPLSPQLARGVYHQLVVLFQVLLVRSSLQCGRCACVSSKDSLLLSWTSEGGDIFLVSLVEIPTTLLEDTLVLPLGFLFVTAVHCWLSIMSGWIHIVSPRGVGIGVIPFSFWIWGTVLTILSSPFGTRTTLVGAGERSWPNRIGDVAVMLAATVFCSGQSLSIST